MGLSAESLRRIRQAGDSTLLDLSGQRIWLLPSQIGQLTNLKALNLSNNHLAELPPQIAQLRNLEALDLSNNRFTSLPHEVTELTKLQTLNLGHNLLSDLPSAIGQLTSLKTLRLSGNHLSNLPPQIGRLADLEDLDLDSNKLTKLPTEIAQLVKLDSLLLGTNQLTDLPSKLGQLTSLRMLDLGHNQLTTLPLKLADLLDNGLLIGLEDNPLQELLLEVVTRGNDALAIYLRSLGDGTPQYEAKVLLVGEGNVGKTSLVAALREAPFVENRPTTHGIEIHPLILRHPELHDIAITVRTWDFGGQEVYRITHQFFFSRRALYLVVWDPRQGQEQNEVEGWLRRIRIRVGHDARALVVATHCDKRNPELNYPRLQQTFAGMLAGQYAVDNETDTGIPALREAIATQAAMLPQMGQLFSPRWAAVRDQILAQAKSEPQIPYKDFEAICLRHKVTGREITTLAELLHDLGQIIYYGEDDGLRDEVVLNPEWLTKAIGYVLEDKPTRHAHGALDHRRLQEIWQDRPDGSAYPARFHPYFLRLMEKFDISYRLDDEEDKSLVAQLVPYEQPPLPWNAATPLPHGFRSLALVCELSEPAPGLMAWLTVRHHRASTGLHWREGVFLRHPIELYASEALLELRHDRQLAIEVRAPSPDLFFHVLRDSMEDLIRRRWRGLSYQLLIPCPTRMNEATSCSGTFKHETLLRRRERDKTSISCPECDEDYNISELLTGFSLEPTDFNRELDQLKGQLSEVWDGVRRIEEQAAVTAHSIRRILKAISTEITDCPRVFTLTTEPFGLSRRMDFWQAHYHLTLWCEHPGQWHPWQHPTYKFHTTKAWLRAISPYAVLIFKGLRLVVPIAGAITGVVNEQLLRKFEREVNLMKTLVEALPGRTAEEPLGVLPISRLNPVESAGLRAFRELLFKLDPARAFGNLHRVQAPAGELLWVCTDHYSEYDPGLPPLPGTEQKADSSKKL